MLNAFIIQITRTTSIQILIDVEELLLVIFIIFI